MPGSCWRAASAERTFHECLTQQQEKRGHWLRPLAIESVSRERGNSAPWSSPAWGGTAGTGQRHPHILGASVRSRQRAKRIHQASTLLPPWPCRAVPGLLRRALERSNGCFSPVPVCPSAMRRASLALLWPGSLALQGRGVWLGSRWARLQKTPGLHSWVQTRHRSLQQPALAISGAGRAPRGGEG